MRVLLGGANAGRTARFDTGFGVAAGFVTVVVGCFVATWLYPPGADADRLLVLAIVITGFAAVVRDALAALVTAGLAWPFYLGFLVDRYGELHWHGRVDLLRLAVLTVASLIGAALGDWVTSGPSAQAGFALRSGQGMRENSGIEAETEPPWVARNGERSPR